MLRSVHDDVMETQWTLLRPLNIVDDARDGMPQHNPVRVDGLGPVLMYFTLTEVHVKCVRSGHPAHVLRVPPFAALIVRDEARAWWTMTAKLGGSHITTAKEWRAKKPYAAMLMVGSTEWTESVSFRHHTHVTMIGGREHKDKTHIMQLLDRFAAQRSASSAGVLTIHIGDSNRGIDAWVKEWFLLKQQDDVDELDHSNSNSIRMKLHVHAADWKEAGAGFKRNRSMIDTSTLCIAFPWPTGKNMGTMTTVTYARQTKGSSCRVCVLV